MANWSERTRYQASWGAWYVQIEIGGQIVELKFDHEPKWEEVEKVAQQVWLNMQLPEPIIILEAEDETEV